ncbi:proclotting enzyme-like isoform X1 [Tachypleus tridentatus]|uniref:proclotting enzyme-like isoform X1 n=1 Tax=Tachypleus tridentatus TaxID=6853 RepID=UPI003FD5E4B8
MSHMYGRTRLCCALYFTVCVTLVGCSGHSVQRRDSFVFPSNPDSDESCSKSGVPNRICKNIYECPQLLRINNVYILKKHICGFDIGHPKVCCPISDEQTTEETVTTPKPTPPVPVHPPNLPRRCGWLTYIPVSKRIIGGHETKVGAWPWMAAIYRKVGGKISLRCGGALVTQKHIITASHCVVNSKNVPHPVSAFTISLGEHNIYSDNDGASPINFTVKAVFYHKKFNSSTFENDIAILKLDGTVSFTDKIHPICLPYTMFRNENLVLKVAYVAGWGKTETEEQPSPVLREIGIPIWEQSHCRQAYKKYLNVTNEQMCAGYGDGKRNTCVGDSGGPLMISSKNLNFYLIGIVSFGNFECASPGFPGVYTRVAFYLDWIARNLV